MKRIHQVMGAIEAGAHSSHAIADQLHITHDLTRRYLSQLVQIGAVVKRDGYPVRYGAGQGRQGRWYDLKASSARGGKADTAGLNPAN